LSDEETINAAVEKQKRAIYAFCRLWASGKIKRKPDKYILLTHPH
jgi:hypothetical protein